MTFGAGYRSGRLVVGLGLLVAIYTIVVVGFLEFDHFAIGFQLVASAAFLYFIAFFPHVLAIFENMMAICALYRFVFGVRKLYRTLLEFLEDVFRVDHDIAFRGLGSRKGEGKRRTNHYGQR